MSEEVIQTEVNTFEVEKGGKSERPVQEEVKEEKPQQNDNDIKDEVGTEAQPKKKSRAQKRIEKLSAEKRELAKEVQELKNNKEAKATETDLDPDDFEDYDSYLDAVTKNTEKQKKPTDNKVDEFQKVVDEIEVKFDETRDKYDDFDELVQKQPEDGGPHITMNMVEVINEIDNSGEVAYALAKDVNESIRISKLSLTKQAIAIGKLSDKLQKADEKQEVKAKKATTAPEPINAIGGGEMVTKTLSDASNFNDYESMREQENRQSGGW